MLMLGNSSFAQWSLTGNTGTTSSNFFGTTDGNSLRFKTNGTTGMTLTTSQNLIIGAGFDVHKLVIFDKDNIGTFAQWANTTTLGTKYDGFIIGIEGIDAIIKQQENAAMLFYTNGNNERMRILGSGEIGIGTTSPTQKLSVKGKILAEEVEVVADVNTYPDFVFEKDYKLLTINELELFIAKNKHLPEIPTTTQAQENNIKLGEMNTKLLQKIEELTLYIIDLQKQINELKQK